MHQGRQKETRPGIAGKHNSEPFEKDGSTRAELGPSRAELGHSRAELP
jgi:hypothetical protein